MRDLMQFEFDDLHVHKGITRIDFITHGTATLDRSGDISTVELSTTTRVDGELQNSRIDADDVMPGLSQIIAAQLKQQYAGVIAELLYDAHDCRAATAGDHRRALEAA